MPTALTWYYRAALQGDEKSQVQLRKMTNYATRQTKHTRGYFHTQPAASVEAPQKGDHSQ
jgi:hypothetical protein